MTAVWDLPCESHTEKLVLLALADNANDEGGCWPSLQTLAAKCGLDKSSICRHLQRLGEKKLIAITHRGDPEQGHISNFYQLKIPLLHVATTPVAASNNPCCSGQPPLVAGCDTNRHIEPSLNRQGKGTPRKSPTVFPNELRDDIAEFRAERQRLWRRSAMENSLEGVTWRSAEDCLEYTRLGKLIQERKEHLKAYGGMA